MALNQRIAGLASTDPEIYEVVRSMQAQIDEQAVQIRALTARVVVLETVGNPPAATTLLETTFGYNANKLSTKKAVF